MNHQDKKWIDTVPYRQLLQRWRFAPAGDPIFQGETGQYYKEILAKRRDALPPGEHTAASKSIGW